MFLKTKENQSVPFLKLFKFAKNIEKFQASIAIIASLLSGICWPIVLIVWSDLANVMVYKINASNFDSTTMESSSDYQRVFNEIW